MTAPGYYEQSYPPSVWAPPEPPEPPAATGATAGTPGTFTPAGSTPPANLAALEGVVAPTPATAWTAGQFVVLGDGSYAHWDGDSWESGATPAAEPEDDE